MKTAPIPFACRPVSRSCAALLLLLIGLAPPLRAEPLLPGAGAAAPWPSVTPRRSDPLQPYQEQQAALQALNDSGRHRLASYPMAKAQCWLDVSFHEYSRNDRSSFVPQALEQSRLISAYLAAASHPPEQLDPAEQTPLVGVAVRLREDLWAAAAALHGAAGWNCAERLVACAEVELVHAGNEYQQQGWRHARPYIQIAEDTLAEARQAAQVCPRPAPLPVEEPVAPPQCPPPVEQAPVQCKVDPPVPPVALPALPAAPAPVVTDKVVLGANVLFAFGRHQQKDLLPGAQQRLDELVGALARAYSRIDHIEVVGHTDRLGQPAQNLLLSRNRAETMLKVLRDKGVTAPLSALGRGAAEPVLDCPGSRPSPALIECLQPNRRVEFNIRGVHR